MNAVAERAVTYLRAGYSVIPIRRDGTKAPVLASWKPYQTAPAGEAEVLAWFDRLRAPGIAAVCGAVSGGLECVDFDHQVGPLFDAWQDAVEAEAPGLVARLSLVDTPRGKHAWLRCPGQVIPGNTKLAVDPAAAKGEQCLIETRGTGGYALLPGTPADCHATRKLYVPCGGVDLTDLAPITPEEREVLIRCARVLTRDAVEDAPPPPLWDGLRPGDDFDLRGPDWVDLLGPHGWACVREANGVRYWRRPGKDGLCWSATSGYCRAHSGADLLRVFSTSAEPFSDGRAYGKFRALALLQYAGDWSACARALVQQGFGQRGVAAKPADGPASPGPGKAEPRTSCGPYHIFGGVIVRDRSDNKGDSWAQPLCNFSAWIVAEVAHDDGSGEVQRFFEIAGRRRTGVPYPNIVVPVAEFGAMDWALRKWGIDAVVEAGQGAKDHLRAAIQLLSHQYEQKVTYSHTGWRELDGRWVYLHGRGSVGSLTGQQAPSVELPHALAPAELPDPPTGEELRAAVRASLALLDLGPERILAPVMGAAYRAVLGPADVGVHLAGASGIFKSEVAALAQQHFGAGFTRTHLPANFLSTGNATEELLFLAKDMLAVVDDYAPGANPRHAVHLHECISRIYRGVGNRQGRQRMRAEGGVRPNRPPRAFPLTTGEDIPGGHSIRARMVIVELERGLIPADRLAVCQEHAAAGMYAAGMAGYVAWLAPQYGEVRKAVPEEVRQYRDAARNGTQHARNAANLGQLLAGWSWFLRFARAVAAISPEREKELCERAEAGLRATTEAQAAHHAEAEPAAHFLRLLASAIASGRAHLAAPAGQVPPPNPDAWGWRASAGPRPWWEPCGRRIGWVDGPHAYLIPDAAYAVANELAREQGEALGCSVGQLGKRLREQGRLSTVDEARRTPKVRRMLAGQTYGVWQVPVAGLSGESDKSDKSDNSAGSA